MDDLRVDIIQPVLIPLEGETTGVLELFPAVWSAAEALVSPIPRLRQQALLQLDKMGAPRLQPLVAYLIATRLTDPLLEIRREAVRVTSALLGRDVQGRAAPEGVRQAVISYISQMRTRSLYGLLQVMQSAPDAGFEIARLLNACPYAGRHLVEIVSDRKTILGLRQQAAELIGMVGYLEAMPTLERLEARLSARAIGQQSMPFIPAEVGSEIELLPSVRRALMLLRAA